MGNYNKHVLNVDSTVRSAMIQLDSLGSDAILFVVDNNSVLLGSLTDGDLRRGFIKGMGFENLITDFIQPNPSYVYDGENNIEKLELFKIKQFKIVPILNKDYQIVDIINFRETTTRIPADALLMAGGEGKRLRPLTENTPKPLLKVGDKPIIEHNIDRLSRVGIKNINISINYLGEQLIDYFGNGKCKDININYVKENKPLGTIGSILLIDKIVHDDIFVMNSDLLTNIDFYEFYKLYKASGADMAVAATSYNVDIPYAVMEVDNKNYVKSLKEKPRFTYYSNAGIYILKKSLLDLIPNDTFYDITELMDRIIEMNLNLIMYPINGYWLDVGKHEDFLKAQEDIKHIKL